MPHFQIAYFRNAAYLNETARHLVPERQMISASEFMELYHNRQISPSASFQICYSQGEGDQEIFLADEMASYLFETGDQYARSFARELPDR